MNLEEIKKAVEAGETVCWKNSSYVVIKDSLNQWFISCKFNESCIGLTHRDNKTLNGEKEDFFVDK